MLHCSTYPFSIYLCRSISVHSVHMLTKKRMHYKLLWIKASDKCKSICLSICSSVCPYHSFHSIVLLFYFSVLPSIVLPIHPSSINPSTLSYYSLYLYKLFQKSQLLIIIFSKLRQGENSKLVLVSFLPLFACFMIYMMFQINFTYEVCTFIWILLLDLNLI